jgi:hypothetical protein
MAQQLNESTGGFETLMQNCPQYEGLLPHEVSTLLTTSGALFLQR